MTTGGLDYANVLGEAQELGLVDTDPAFDLDGIDAALQCGIVANVLEQGGSEHTFEDAIVEGIAGLPGSALDLVAEDGSSVWSERFRTSVFV